MDATARIGEPTLEELQALLESKRVEQRQRAKEARARGYVFDPIIGYIPWGEHGPSNCKRVTMRRIANAIH